MQTLNTLLQICQSYCRIFSALQSEPLAKVGAEAGPADGQSNARIAPAQGHQLPQVGGAAEGLQPCQGYPGAAGARRESNRGVKPAETQTYSTRTQKPPPALGRNREHG